ncbi:PREDICTED: probable leucine-rich repeat receptor-like serine/threonine-protein kinase At3g14840 [Camelina sativa]|uniref:Probable leucine-rich repeat receptor-like serine/threonine-protein kinase At3g14840 n=1 Tax=Camelina sativa TaxID=90675 RepID=A0ABM0ZE21_CAMSA|nr:PREDICTED: probable leucine-rich repeat receptor-like serine/threonine-protein kinase At3g14840 [Camelina sativa]
MSFNRQLLLPYFFVFLVLSNFVSATTTPKEEVDALRGVAEKLQVRLDFEVDPCGVSASVRGMNGIRFTESVTCNCSSVVCHITSISGRSDSKEQIWVD